MDDETAALEERLRGLIAHYLDEATSDGDYKASLIEAAIQLFPQETDTGDGEVTEEAMEAAAFVLIQRCMERQENAGFTLTDVVMDGKKIGPWRIRVEALEE